MEVLLEPLVMAGLGVAVMAQQEPMVQTALQILAAVEVVLGQTELVALAVQASLYSKSPMPIVRHSLAVLPTLYRLQAQT